MGERGRETTEEKRKENRLLLLPLSVEKVTFNLQVETFISICRDRSSLRLADAKVVCVRNGMFARVCAACSSSVLGPHDRQATDWNPHRCVFVLVYMRVYAPTVEQQV